MTLKRLAFTLLILILGILGAASPVFAQGQVGTVVSPDQIIAADYFASDSTVTIAGTVNGDAYLVGGNILVSGTINGSLLALGGTINVTGNVTNNIRVIAGQLIVSGPVGGNITSLGGTTNLTAGANVSGSLVAGAGNVSIFAPLGRGINAVAGQMTVGSSVGGDVSAYVGQLILTPSARVAGDLTYWSDLDAQVQSGAEVAGTTTRNTPPTRAPQEPRQPIDRAQIQAALARAAFIARLVDFVSALIIGLLLIYVFPVFTQMTVGTIRKEPWKSLGVGLLTLIVTPIIGFILLALIVGIPLALILFGLYLIALYVSRIFVILLVGELILRKASPGWALVLGLVLYEVITLIPFLGPIVVFFVLLFGLGAIVLGENNVYRQLRGKNLA
ncbi:MAG TPA: hypothetical protein VMW04_01850 [Patescibacteria group bacterium]|nr:hypothetical protein [Patescibacteria group bacterium]